jgi:glucose-1-phosphatase
MIKAIIFDFGNVLYNFTNEIFLEKVGKLNGKTRDENYKLIYQDFELPKQFETGLISPQEFYREISKLCKLNISLEELKEIYTRDKFTPVLGMNEIVKSFKNKYKIALLSNTSEWDYKYGIENAPEVKLMDTVTLSYQVGVMKPRIEIYYDALKKLALLPEECVYTDDIIDYVKAAEKVGMKGIHFENANYFLSELNKLL